MKTGTWIQLGTITLLAIIIIKLQPLNDAAPTIDAISKFMQSQGLLPSGS